MIAGPPAIVSKVFTIRRCTWMFRQKLSDIVRLAVDYHLIKSALQGILNGYPATLLAIVLRNLLAT